MNRNTELVKNTLILSIGTLVPKLITLITLPLMTACLTTGEYGNYDLIITFASLLIPVMTLQIQQALFRKLLAEKADMNKKLFVTSSFVFLLISFAIFVPIVYIVSRFVEFTDGLFIYICLLLLAESYYNVIGQIVRGIGHNLIFSFAVIVYSVTNLIFLSISLLVLHMGLKGVIISLALGYSVSAIYMLIHSGAYKYVDVRCFSRESLKDLLAFSAPIVPSSISLWIVNLSDRLVITAVYGSSANGIYSVANKIPQLYSTGYSVFNLAWTETASKASDEGDPAQYYTELFRTLYKFLVGFMLLLLAVTPLVFKILVNQSYSEAYYQIPFLYFGVFFNSIVQFYAGIYIALKHTKSVGISSAVGALINLVVNVMFIHQIGLYAASISTLVAYLCIALFRKWELKKYINIQYNRAEITIGMVTFILCAFLCYQNQIISSVICLVVALIYNLFYNREIAFAFIGKMLKKLKKKS